MIATRSECPLKLPKTDEIKIADSTVDSVAFFFHPTAEYPIGVLPPAIWSALNSTVQQHQHSYLVHWVIEYKTLAIEDVKRQVLYGMTSGLYQRRALGRLDDFVFGTAHAGSGLVVYAARWETWPSEAQPPPDISREGKIATDAELGGTASTMHPAATAKKRSGEPEPGVEHTETDTKLAGPNGEGFPNKRFKSGLETMPPPVADDGGDTNKNSGYEIVVYQLGEYVTVDPVDMIKYYLLMRASCKLADGYRTDLFTDPWATVVRVSGFHLFSIGRHPLRLAQKLLQDYQPCTKILLVGVTVKYNWRTANQIHRPWSSSQKTQQSGKRSGDMSDKLRSRSVVVVL
ncbi:hypothetical protein FRC06_003351 [Ceratobasidium sp. 370]|nr:hypothetical protein FRC06_003351 [Ceratobasidium sp. 370]